MKTLVDHAIILSRIDYQEADRILTVLSREHGKITVIAKGARRSKSKLAGGIELFSTNQISFMPGKGDVGTLVSSRLEQSFNHIVRDVARTMFAYDVLKSVYGHVEQGSGQDLYEWLQGTLAGLHDLSLPFLAIRLWSDMHFLQITGHAPNMQTDTAGQPLAADKLYDFSFEDSGFVLHPSGAYKADHIKLLRLTLRAAHPKIIANVSGGESLLEPTAILAERLRQYAL
jgi:DNA repair protein RecO (recombination protein O)